MWLCVIIYSSFLVLRGRFVHPVKISVKGFELSCAGLVRCHDKTTVLDVFTNRNYKPVRSIAASNYSVLEFTIYKEKSM